MMGTVTKCGKIRRLTPRECFRPQGFPDELYERAANMFSIYQVLPELIKLWGLNVRTDAEAKNFVQQSGR